MQGVKVWKGFHSLAFLDRAVKPRVRGAGGGGGGGNLFDN